MSGNTAVMQFADEEVVSIYGYCSGYRSNRDQSIDLIIADFEARMAILDHCFNIGTSFDKDWLIRMHKVCPAWIEKFFPNFRWQAIASTYGEAVQMVFVEISERRKFKSRIKGKFFGPEYLRQFPKSEDMFQRISDDQKGHNIIVMPGNFGVRYQQSDGTHIVSSSRRAREKLVDGAFCPGAFAGGNMLLTHPERLMDCDDLFIDFAGDGFDDPYSDARLDLVPVFGFNCHKNEVEFASRSFSHVYEHCGSATSFLPQVSS